MKLREIPFLTIDGEATSLADYSNKVVLVVNVASRCGLTPQYKTLEELQTRYGGRGFTVLGFPCNQFLGQEPGTTEEIKEFCSLTYGVSFPLMEKIKVNGRHRHPLYDLLRDVPDSDGKKGRVKWNFEKFVIAPDDSISRFRPTVVPDDPAIVAALEAVLPR